MNDEFVKEIIGGKVYMSMQNLADKYGITKRTVRDRVREIEAESGKGKRYSSKSIISDGNIVLVNELIFLDWLSVRQLKKNKATNREIPAYDPIEWAYQCGWPG